MKRICPVCGKKCRIKVKSYRPTKYSVYERVTSYKCSECRSPLTKNKNRPSAAENVTIFLITLAEGAVLYFLLPLLYPERQTFEQVINGILLLLLTPLCGYETLADIHAYFPAKLLPADSGGVPIIKKPAVTVTLKDGNFHRLKQFDILTYENTGVIFCVKCDAESGIAYGYFISDCGAELIGGEISLRINGRTEISCIVSLLNDEINV